MARRKEGQIRSEGTSITPRILITMGDPAGVGPEVIPRAVASGDFLGETVLVVVGDEGILKERAKGTDLDVVCIKGPEEAEPRGKTLWVIEPWTPSHRPVPGHPTPETGEAAYRYILYAARKVLQGEADALVTGPVSKEIIAASGRPFTGHTEFLAQLAQVEEVAMLLVGPKLRVCLLTTHIPLAEVPSKITREGILRKAVLLEKGLKELFGIPRPRIALCALNPHGGEGGKLGSEEQKVLKPAVEEARKRGLDLEGPFPSDSLFFWALEGMWDAILALYHDQGLIPFKMIHFHEGVNLTLGLPFIRTSPDHGTAFDIAGKGLADPRSMREAIRLAITLARRKRCNGLS